MSQRVIITVECDGMHDTPTEATPVEVRALGHEVEVDLCDVHAKELRDLVEHLADIGRPLGRARRERAASPAPARKVNGDDVRVQPIACPECGQTYRGPQGLGAHRRSKHGIAGTSTR